MRIRLVTAVLLLSFAGCSDESAKKENSDLRNKLDALSVEKAKSDGEIIRKDSELSATKDRLAEAEVALDVLKKENSDLRDANSKYAYQVAELNEHVKASDRSLLDQKQKISELEAQVQKLESIPRKGALSGVITYYFNENYGDKPDVGADIYICSESAYPAELIKTINEYQLVKIERMRWESLKSDPVKYADTLRKIQKEFEDAGLHTPADFAKLYDDAAESWRVVESGAATVHLTADGNGNYRRSLSPGKYLLLIQSKHERGDNHLELIGKIETQEIEVKGDDEVTVSLTFYP